MKIRLMTAVLVAVGMVGLAAGPVLAQSGSASAPTASSAHKSGTKSGTKSGHKSSKSTTAPASPKASAKSSGGKTAKSGTHTHAAASHQGKAAPSSADDSADMLNQQSLSHSTAR